METRTKARIEKENNEESREEIDPLALPYVMMSELGYLPTCSGIYFAIEETGQVAYIGQSINIRQRWRAHHVESDLCDLSDLHSARRVRIAWAEAENGELDELEVELIRRFRPRLNTQNVPVEKPVLVRPEKKERAHAVRLKVREMAEQKGVENPFALARATGLGYAVCHRMWNGETTLIALETIAKLCDGLKVKPSQIIEYTPN